MQLSALCRVLVCTRDPVFLHTLILRQWSVFENTDYCIFCTEIRLLHVCFVQQPPMLLLEHINHLCKSTIRVIVNSSKTIFSIKVNQLLNVRFYVYHNYATTNHLMRFWLYSRSSGNGIIV